MGACLAWGGVGEVGLWRQWQAVGDNVPAPIPACPCPWTPKAPKFPQCLARALAERPVHANVRKQHLQPQEQGGRETTWARGTHRLHGVCASGHDTGGQGQLDMWAKRPTDHGWHIVIVRIEQERAAVPHFTREWTSSVFLTCRTRSQYLFVCSGLSGSRLLYCPIFLDFYIILGTCFGQGNSLVSVWSDAAVRPWCPLPASFSVVALDQLSWVCNQWLYIPSNWIFNSLGMTHFNSHL